MDVVSALPLPGDCESQEDQLCTLGRRMLELLGENPARDGLQDTPERFARSMQFLCSGYHATPDEVVGRALFPIESEDLVVIRDVEFYSLCEHHLLPFFGKAHLAYIPRGQVVGLSKVPRLVDVFARRLQVQERLGAQLADAFMEVVQPHAVAVLLEATHLCMMMRGVERQCSSTHSLALRGSFQSDRELRREVLAQLRKIG